MKYLKPDAEVAVVRYGDELLGVDVPQTVDLAVTKTDPGLRGDTATGGSKPATVETGAVVNVPLFINEGDIIRVDTRTEQYVQRISG